LKLKNVKSGENKESISPEKSGIKFALLVFLQIKRKANSCLRGYRPNLNKQREEQNEENKQLFDNFFRSAGFSVFTDG